MNPIGAELHSTLVAVLFGLAALTFVGLLVVVAPYGRHARKGWGPSISSRTGWIAMESPAVVVFAGVYLLGPHRFEPVPLVLLGLWQFHYLQRTFVYPFRMRAAGKTIPVAIVASGAAFNTFNAVVNATCLTAAWRLSSGSIGAPHLWIGAGILLAGWALNVHSDSILRRLRAPGETGYRIPHGGAYRWVSCPNYLGEIVEWAGWAIATWSTAGLAFAVYTFSNLFPRALSHHRWYREEFPDYPRQRRAVVPYLF